MGSWMQYFDSAYFLIIVTYTTNEYVLSHACSLTPKADKMHAFDPIHSR